MTVSVSGQALAVNLLFRNKDVRFRQERRIMTTLKTNIKLLSREDLQSRLSELGLKKYRADQILKWMYSRYAASFDEMTNIAKPERQLLASHFFIPTPQIITTESSADGTRKFLFRLEDNHTVESVLIPDKGRQTLCISSQVGCQQACLFCLTGRGGFLRNLSAYEITDQVLDVSHILFREGARGVTNIVLMGMGEPLANLEEVLKALRVITAEYGLNFSPRRVTVSTDGLVPEMGKLGKSGIKVNLAVSLNATTDEVRSTIMPVNRRYAIEELLRACKRYPLEPRRRITFEYVLLKGMNDSAADAHRLAGLLRGIRCKVNLIPFNPFPGSEFGRPDDVAVRRFQKILLDHHYTAPVRESRGRDISAACGQLRERRAAKADGNHDK